jgi:hypothetical protein
MSVAASGVCASTGQALGSPHPLGMNARPTYNMLSRRTNAYCNAQKNAHM